MGFLGMWNSNLALFLQSGEAIHSKTNMLKLYHVIKLQDFLSSSKLCTRFVSKTNRKLMESELKWETEPN